MSNPLKGIGKVFKKVVKVVKKIALPALAIGAVVLTGGAALGLLPALGGAGGLLASVGIKGALAGILTSAAKAATFGALGAIVMGKNPIKGATMGFITGGVLGGLGAAFGGAGGAGAAAGTAGNAAGTAGAAGGAGAASQGALTAAANAAGLPSGAISTIPGVASAGTTGLGLAATAPVVASAAPVASSGILGQAGNFLSQNQVLAGSLVQGLGSGLAAKQDAKERRRESDAVRASYAGIDQGLYFMPQGTDGMGPLIESQTAQGGKVRYDRRTGQLVSVG
jgi:hypothetical protein